MVMAGIRTMLISGALAPGSKIDQIDLARRFGVSIVPIREALGRLASVGLIEIISHRGAYVADVSPDELVDLYTIRELLEEQAAKIGVEKLTDADVEALEHLAESMALSAKRRDFDQFLAANRELHFTLYRAAKRRHMLQIIERMWDLSARYAHLQLHAVPDRAQQSLSEVRAIVAGCRRRDRDEVGLMVRYKVHQTCVHLLERMHPPVPKEEGGEPVVRPLLPLPKNRRGRRRTPR
jgi:DNA-binding GntR family transcriptional regulator